MHRDDWHVRVSPAVSLALDSADGEQDIVLAEGCATVVTRAGQHPHFLAAKFREKYAGRWPGRCR